ncbi:MAG: hypothetical protein FWH20_02215 [Oscillospiraceae bacterium]|nr:hypothetical protein [Oscillospiraceae bacterium]
MSAQPHRTVRPPLKLVKSRSLDTKLFPLATYGHALPQKSILTRDLFYLQSLWDERVTLNHVQRRVVRFFEVEQT